jgi:L-gulonolactone oxidase
VREGRAVSTAWHNWAGNQRATATVAVRPYTRDDLVATVRAAAAAGRRVRVAGAGRSCSAVARTDGCRIDVSRYGRLLAVDRDARTATAQAGITILELCAALAERELALPTMGEAGAATLGGSLATGTHGTGGRLPGLAGLVTSMELILADGSVLTVSAEHEPDVFGAARVGLGALGVVSTVTVQCVPAFNLRTVEEPAPLSDVLASLEQRVADNEHFEFLWLPFTEWTLTRRSNRTDRPVEGRDLSRARLGSLARGELAVLSRAWGERLPPSAARGLAPAGAALMCRLDRAEYVARGYHALTRPRLTRFLSMEYALDRNAAADAVRGVQACLAASSPPVCLPVQVRFSASDGSALSPSFGRDSCHVALHASLHGPFAQYFAEVEGILTSLGGRPHWGMLHSQTAATLAPKYPQWAQFQAVRSRLDAGGVFGNDELDRVLGPVQTSDVQTSDVQTRGQG